MSASTERAADVDGDKVTVNVIGSPTVADSRRRPTTFSRAPSASPSYSSQSGGTPSAARRAGAAAEWSLDNSFATLLRRHRFLIVTMVILFVLCAIYLYFAVSMTE